MSFPGQAKARHALRCSQCGPSALGTACLSPTLMPPHPPHITIINRPTTAGLRAAGPGGAARGPAHDQPAGAAGVHPAQRGDGCGGGVERGRHHHEADADRGGQQHPAPGAGARGNGRQGCRREVGLAVRRGGALQPWAVRFGGDVELSRPLVACHSWEAGTAPAAAPEGRPGPAAQGRPGGAFAGALHTCRPLCTALLPSLPAGPGQGAAHCQPDGELGLGAVPAGAATPACGATSCLHPSGCACWRQRLRGLLRFPPSRAHTSRRPPSECCTPPFPLPGSAADFLQIQCAMYINSDLPGLSSMYQMPGKPMRCVALPPALWPERSCRDMPLSGGMHSAPRARSFYTRLAPALPTHPILPPRLAACPLQRLCAAAQGQAGPVPWQPVGQAR